MHARPTFVIIVLSTILLPAALADESRPDDKSVSEWIKSLGDTDAGVRTKAAAALAALGPRAEAAIPALIDRLADENADVQARATDALVAIGAAAVPACLKTLLTKKSADEERSKAALTRRRRLEDVLRRMGKVSAPALLGALKDGNPDARDAAVEILGQMGPVSDAILPAVTERMQDRDHHVQISAALAYFQLGGKTERAIAVLLENAKSEDYRFWALSRLQQFGPLAEPAVPALIPLLKVDNAVERSQAAEVLGEIGPAASAAVPALLNALKDPEEIVRGSAINTLGDIGPAAKAAIPAILAALKDPAVRADAVRALGRIGPRAKEAIPALVDALRDDDVKVRRASALALPNLGPEVKRAIPAVLRALEDKDATVRRRAADVIALHGGEASSALPGLKKLLKDEDMSVRKSAAFALGSVRPAKEAVPLLLEALSKDDVRYIAIRALGRIGPDAKEAGPRLVELLTARDRGIAIAAAASLYLLGEQRERALKLLEAARTDRDTETRVRAAIALWRMKQRRDDQLKVMIDALKDEKSRLHTIVTLADLDADAKPAVPALRELLRSSEDNFGARWLLNNIAIAEARAKNRDD